MREFLKGLGLDKETIDTIMAEHGKLMTASTEKINTLSSSVNDLTAQINEYKKFDVNALNSKIAELEKANGDLVNAHKSEIDGLKFDSALELAINKTKTVDPVALRAHLNMKDLSYDEESKGIKNFDEQVDKIKKDYAYLFNIKDNGADHGGINGGNDKVSLSGALTDYYK